jgi:hypothetical protein
MEPKFNVDQLVKFKEDHDRMTGKVLSYSWDSENGYTYKVSSRYYDVNEHGMIDGIITCREDELVDMTGYTGSRTPIKPDVNVDLKEKAEPATPEVPAEPAKA